MPLQCSDILDNDNNLIFYIISITPYTSHSIKVKSMTDSKTSSNTETDKEYVGNVPVVSIRSDQSSIPQLPHISGAMPLTPIGEASREGTL
jgi:hypothetical protein